MAEILFARQDDLDEAYENTLANVVAAQAAQAAAEAAQTAAETAETNAETAETNAETAEANAEAAQAAAEVARDAALVAETNAETAETNAELAETNAETAQAAAELAETGAETARDFANLWATEDEDVSVDDGVNPAGFSAFHWAQKAEDAAGGTGAAQSVFGNPTGTPATRTDIELAADTVIGRDGSGNVDDIQITTLHIQTGAKTGVDLDLVTGTAGTDGNLGQWNADGDMVDSSIAAANVVVDADIANMLETTDIGVTVQGFDADTLKADVADTLTAGFKNTTFNAGTQSSGTFTPNADNGNFQRAVNGGAHTLAPPADDSQIIIQYTNNGSAGAITTSSFTIVGGDAISTTNGDDFFFYITKVNGFSSLEVRALQA